MTNAPTTPAHKRKLITIASGKGGVGKTWLSVTLAHTLAGMKRKVLLFDGDLGLANIDIQLGLLPERDLGAVISGDYMLGDVAMPYTDTAGVTMDVIAGKSGSGALGSLSQETLNSIRTELENQTKNYDHVLLDLAAGIDPSVNTLSNHAGRIIVVMTSDPTSLTDAYAFIKLAVARNPSANISIVVNNVPSKKDGEKTYGAIKRAAEGFLKISPPLLGIIRSDTKVVDAIRSQMPLLARHPQADAASDVKAIAKSLIE
ncbi:nucleotide-binding protein [Kordiimonas aquimaris]|uniref:nucleotide-binding protein n=1 Tax=Kordiimonas aquimaris TaxID=707591 RepID=UPI0021D10E62|nr:P-loop NTPase [Kordiimonas aquimaris]